MRRAGRSPEGPGPLLSIKRLSSGAVADVQQRSGFCAGHVGWTPDSRFLVCFGSVDAGRSNATGASGPGVVLMDAETGEVSWLAPGQEPEIAADGRAVYALRSDHGELGEPPTRLVERQIASGSERELLRANRLTGLRGSPDGRLLATVATESTGERALPVVPTDAGPPRRLVVGSGSSHVDLFWAPDGQSIFVGQDFDPDTWTIAEAKAKFSEVLDRAATEGPQTVTRNGRAAAVVVSAEEWARKTRRKGTLADFLAGSPLRGSSLRVARRKDGARKVDL